ncbi:hypothetical protein H2200_013195 [Cladophialophora chaetospira]|uniref:F-box domain-containing protein n=1 Tax=Cladophialophora chaetospira TaxID=386627 RepID=A0AA38WWC5_9EURO|nr:hypothetical protein H2200_013195 [Cladophialophora chaetospira]
MAGPHPNQTLFLLHLPTEILLQIIQELAPGHVMSIYNHPIMNFRQTCKECFDLCEPTFCSGFHTMTPLRSKEINLLLSARKNRHNYVKTLQIDADHCQDQEANFRTMMVCIADLPNLKDLSVWITKPWSAGSTSTGLTETTHFLKSTLVCQLESCVFAELQTCQIIYRDAAYEQNPFQLELLLKAPKLSSLTIRLTDLRGFRSVNPKKEGSSLRELILYDCQTDEQAIVTLLSWPSALRCMEFRAGFTDADTEFHVLQHLIRTLASYQPGLGTLKLKINWPALVESDRYRNAFDLRELTCLETLAFDVPVHTSGVYRAAYPTNVFDLLPTSIRTVSISSQRCISVDKLATALLGRAQPARSDPSLGPALHFWSDEPVENVKRPFRKHEQEEDDRRCLGIFLLMDCLRIPQVQYTIDCWPLRRTIRATTPARANDESETVSDSDGYRTEDTTVEWPYLEMKRVNR